MLLRFIEQAKPEREVAPGCIKKVEVIRFGVYLSFILSREGDMSDSKLIKERVIETETNPKPISMLYIRYETVRLNP